MRVKVHRQTAPSLPAPVVEEKPKKRKKKSDEDE